MEKVWEELKRIEADAEKIRVDAQKKAQSIMATAQQNSEKLVANSQTYAEEEDQQVFTNTVEEANRIREEHLKANQAATEKLKLQAGKHMDAAVTKIINSIIKEEKH